MEGKVTYDYENYVITIGIKNCGYVIPLKKISVDIDFCVNNVMLVEKVTQGLVSYF